MITITQRAAEQIRKSAEQTGSEGMCLRIALRLEEDGSFDYGLGFDEKSEDDELITSEGINILVAGAYKELLKGARLDFVEIDKGVSQFIFTNPNDPKHAAGSEPPD